MIEEMKKTYNPFKMWGSYIGIIPGIFFGFIIAANSITPESLNEIFWQYTIGGAIVGFLIGWGIHFLIRKIKN